MRVLRHFVIVLSVVWSSIGFAAAESNNKLIVRLDAGLKVQDLEAMGYQNVEVLVSDLGIYLVEAPAVALRRSGGLRALAQQMRQMDGVVYAQEDHKVTWRSTPNDKNFSQQWDMIKTSSNFGIDALGAWSLFGGGGFDSRGNEPVVAVVDGGVDVTHEDLAANIWVNTGEIPNNGIDDDGNGYIDDINGWNAYSSNGKVTADRHGTHVAGTIGAVGNNSIHGAGVNWNVKIMGISGSSGTTSVVLRAYGYVLAQKKLWLETDGLKGANVVATNSSFGVDLANCRSSTYAAWNDIYNEMGKVGILHAAATANRNIDVDARGDVPTGCDSPYIISVTNTQKTGRRNSGAAYGQTQIDLAAPGTDIFSTLPRNGWGTMTGTSMATPHVAGAVAYMHSVASSNFNNFYYTNPGEAALRLKSVMLETVTPMDALKRETVSGGILNLKQAAEKINSL